MRIGKLLWILVVFSGLFITSCKQSQDLEALKAEVMKIHDDSMAKIGELREFTYQLEEMVGAAEDSVRVKELIQELTKADDDMMVWMQAYVEPESGLDSFLLDQKDKISTVADQIYTSLDNAKKYLDE